MNHSTARRSTWVMITLVLLMGVGAYFWFQTKAAVTIGSDNPSFQADLKNTLALQAGVGSPTFTRATTATVTDFEGLIKTAKSGEARFEGARRVENKITNSENLSVWLKQGSCTVDSDATTSPIGGLTADRVNFETSAVSATWTSSVSAANIYTVSVYAKEDPNYPGKQFRFASWSNAENYKYSGNITLTSSWVRYSYRFTITDTVTTIFYLMNGSGGGVGSGFFWGMQVESVTGQSNQNPSEYVSTNVKTSAPYHGANVDGVKYFTTQNGNTVASNVVTEATGAAIPDATLHGYVAEGARTNLYLQSETFSTSWLKQVASISIVTNTVVSPSGAITADKFIAGTSSGNQELQLAMTWTNTPYTQSVYAKAGEYDFLHLQNYDHVTDIQAWFNLSTGVVQSSSGITSSSITSVGGGWYRCSITFTPVADTSYSGIGASYTTTRAYTGDGTSGIYIWGAQLEAASFASSYIPTTTAAVTRNADVLTYPWELPAIGSVSAEVSLNPFGSVPNSNMVSKSASLAPLSYYSTNRLRFLDGTNNPILISGGNFTIGTRKVASRWNNVSAKMNLYKDGVASTEGPYAGTFHGGNATYIGGHNVFFGALKNVKIWKKALTDTQLQNLTSTTSAVSQSAVAKTTIKATGVTKMNVSQNGKLTDGLVGLWSFNGQDVSGTTASDRSGQGHDATLVNRPAPTQGKSGQALSFNGTNQSATIGSAYNGVKTVSFWVKPATTTQSIIDLNATATVDINAGTVRGNTFGTPTVYTDGAPMNTITNTDWHHIAITTDTGTNASNVILGKIASAYFSGTLDEVRLYSRALSANEVWQLYSLGASAFQCGSSSVRDADGNAYGTVLVGTQCWMASNLKVGTRIAGTSNQTNNAVIEKYCYDDTDANCTTDGGLYQWDEAMQYSTTEGARGICPAGWHIPRDAEQYALENYLKDTGQTCDANRIGTFDCSTAGTKLKSGGSSGMNISLAGFRNTDGLFYYRTSFAYPWSSLQSGGYAWYRFLNSSEARVYRSTNSKALGFSVRCLKD